MQRLISLFREPEDPWPSLAAQDEGEEHKAFGDERSEPLYFADLMAYLRERNRGAAVAAPEPREGAD